MSLSIYALWQQDFKKACRFLKSGTTNSYETTMPVTVLQVFIDVSNDVIRKRVMELLRERVRELGGG